MMQPGLLVVGHNGNGAHYINGHSHQANGNGGSLRISSPDTSIDPEKPQTVTPKRYRQFLKKYLHTPPSPFAMFMGRHPRWLAIITPPVIIQIVYWILATEYGFYKLFPIRYEMMIVMMFGSFIGGATAEGSGAIAFPVMTLLLHIPPTVARDFAVMIQTIGMNSAAVSVLLMGVLTERHTMLFASIGGFFGTILSLELIEPNLSGLIKKMIFVSVFFSFAIALYLLNGEKKRIVYDQIQNFNFNKACILLLTGFVGGLFAGIGGSGLEIFSFSVITLLFRVTEKVATPTTVSLAGINCAFVFFWSHHKLHGIDQLSWEYFAVCVPVSCITGPLGATVSSYLHRQTLAVFIYVLETIALLGAIIILRPRWEILLLCVLVCFGFYYGLERLGRKWINGGSAKVAPDSNGNGKLHTLPNVRATPPDPVAYESYANSWIESPYFKVGHSPRQEILVI